MSVLCVCIREYYNTTLESEDTHATSTGWVVLQSVEEHFIVALWELVIGHKDKEHYSWNSVWFW